MSRFNSDNSAAVHRYNEGNTFIGCIHGHTGQILTLLQRIESNQNSVQIHSNLQKIIENLNNHEHYLNRFKDTLQLENGGGPSFKYYIDYITRISNHINSHSNITQIVHDINTYLSHLQHYLERILKSFGIQHRIIHPSPQQINSLLPSAMAQSIPENQRVATHQRFFYHFDDIEPYTH